MADNGLPLTGKRVLEISTAWAGPMLGRILADLGAEVVKIETMANVDNWRGAVTGDDRARYPDGEPGEHPWNRSAWFNTQNLGKKSIGIDAKAPAARAAVDALVRATDIVISNFAGGALQRLKLDYSTLREIRPDIILVEMNVTGEGGPLEHVRGVGPTMEAMAGMTPLTGYGDGIPQRTGPAYVDPIGAMNASMAVVMAVYHHARTGQGQRIELAQREALMHLYGERLLLQAIDSVSVEPDGNHMFDAAPHDAFRAQGDDEWIALAVLDDTVWKSLCDVIDRTDLASDSRYAHVAGRAAHADILRAAIEAWTKMRDKHAAVAILQANGVAAAPVNSGKDLFHDPQLRATGQIFEVTHPEAGRHSYHGLPFHFSGASTTPPGAAPLLGQHTDEILRDWGQLSAAEIAMLHAAGVLHQAEAAQTGKCQ